MTMTDADLEPAARRLCEIRGVDPDGTRFWPGPDWQMVLPELRAHLEREQALRETIAKPQEG